MAVTKTAAETTFSVSAVTETETETETEAICLYWTLFNTSVIAERVQLR